MKSSTRRRRRGKLSRLAGMWKVDKYVRWTYRATERIVINPEWFQAEESFNSRYHMLFKGLHMDFYRVSAVGGISLSYHGNPPPTTVDTSAALGCKTWATDGRACQQFEQNQSFYIENVNKNRRASINSGLISTLALRGGNPRMNNSCDTLKCLYTVCGLPLCFHWR